MTRISGLTLLLIAALACDDAAPRTGAPVGAGTQSATPTPPEPAAWTVTELTGPAGFRAFAWGAGDTLHGIVRGRLASASLGGDTAVDALPAWSAGAAANATWWTDEAGLHVRRAGVDSLVVPTSAAPSREHTGPAVLWAPDGLRALLRWTAESRPATTLLDGRGHRPLRAHLEGHVIGDDGLWLDSARILLPATSFHPRTGAAEYREDGYRTDLAVLDVARDTAILVVQARDGEFIRLEGWLHPDTVLVGRYDGSVARGHAALSIRTWQLRPRLEDTGRAAAAHGVIALLRPLRDPGSGGEMAWELVMVRRDGRRDPVGRFTGHDVRLLWHPTKLTLAVAQESEAPGGYRTVIVR